MGEFIAWPKSIFSCVCAHCNFCPACMLALAHQIVVYKSAKHAHQNVTGDLPQQFTLDKHSAQQRLMILRDGQNAFDTSYNSGLS